MLNFQPLITKPSPILHTGKLSTPVKSNGVFSLKNINEDQFNKTISFNGKNKKTRELIHNGVRFFPDGKITTQKQPLFKEVFETTIKEMLTPEEQCTFKQFFIERPTNNDKNTLGENGLPGYIEMTSLSQKLYDHGMSLEHTNPDRSTFFFLKDEINKSQEYRDILYKNPLIYNNKLYIPESINTEDLQSLATETYDNVIKTNLNETDANTFKLFFVDKEQETITPEELTKLKSALFDATYSTDEKSKALFSFFDKMLEASPVYKIKEADYQDFQEQRLDAIDQAIEKGDVNTYYTLLNKEDEYEVENFCDFISGKMLQDHNVYLRIAEEITGIEFVKEMYDSIDLFAKLGMPLPDEINANFEDLEPPEHKGKTITAGNYKIYIEQDQKTIVRSSIHINKELFSKEFQKNNSQNLKDIFNTFYHEIGHHLHASNALEKFNCGIEEILTNEEKTIFKTFNQRVKRLALEINRPQLDCFDTNQAHDQQNNSHQDMSYNMSNFEDNWEFLLKLIEYDRSDKTSKYNLAFPVDFTEQVKPVMQKLINAIEMIKKNLSDNGYALCNPSETIAEASKEELNGHWLSKDFRELLYKLGKPKAPNMCYLDEH